MVSKIDSRIHILIIDDCSGPSMNNKTVYSDFVHDADNCVLFILTSKNGLSPADKLNCISFEIEDICENGMMEVVAESMHKQYRIDLIYTKQEDLIIRAAHLRKLFGCSSGHSPAEALVYRDKNLMKEYAQQAHFPVPPFALVRTPADVLGFTNIHGFPIVLKPILGSCSTGIKVISSGEDCWKYFEAEFFAGLDDAKGRHDHAGDIIVEKFVKSKMFHVNGYAKNGKIKYVWSFAYLNTNLGFTNGSVYGNVFVPKSEIIWQALVSSAQSLIDALPKTRDLLFHLELFQDESDPYTFILCEIAARGPGGSIALLIDKVEGGKHTFPELEFRLNIGLNPRHEVSLEASLNYQEDSNPSNICCGDLMIPLRIGTLLSVPRELPLKFKNIELKQIAQPGHTYSGFDINQMNTCARLIATNMNSNQECQQMLLNAANWYMQKVQYDSAVSSGLLGTDEILNKSFTKYEPWLYNQPELKCERHFQSAQ